MARTSKAAPRDQGESLTNEQRIGVLLQQGLDNDTIFYVLTKNKSNIATIDDDEQRRKHAEKYECPCPPFDKVARQRLMEQIRKCKSRYKMDNEELDLYDSLREDDGSARSIKDIPIVDIPRFSLGIDSLDQLLGSDPINKQVGMPCGSVLILGASKGTGKTRLSVKIAANVGDPKRGKDEKGNEGVLYIQNEEKVEIFRSRSAKFWTPKHKILVSSSDNLIQQAALINKHRPKLIMIDSIDDTRQAKFAAGKQATLCAYKALAADLGCAFWIISHVNGEGNIKGGTYAGHKVDIELLARRLMSPVEFVIECPEKNRYGATGKSAWFMHTPEDIVAIEKKTNRSFSMSEGKKLDAVAVPLRGVNVLRRGNAGSLPAGGVPDADDDE